MGLTEIVAKLRAKAEGMKREDLPDDVTTDRYLRSLRRQRRIQMESVEKEYLKKKIAAFERRKQTGIMITPEKERLLKGGKRGKKGGNILHLKGGMLGRGFV